MNNGKGLNDDEALKIFQEGLKELESPGCCAGCYEAIVAFDKATKLDPGKAVYWLELGLTCNYVGLFREAIAAFDKLISLEPENGKALRGKDIATRRLPYQTRFKINGEWKYLGLNELAKLYEV